MTYVVSKEGVVQSIYDDLFNAGLHPKKALAALIEDSATPQINSNKKD